MANTTTTTTEELVLRTLITDLKFMNLELDRLGRELDKKMK